MKVRRLSEHEQAIVRLSIIDARYLAHGGKATFTEEEIQKVLYLFYEFDGILLGMDGEEE